MYSEKTADFGYILKVNILIDKQIIRKKKTRIAKNKFLASTAGRIDGIVMDWN